MKSCTISSCNIFLHFLTCVYLQIVEFFFFFSLQNFKHLPFVFYVTSDFSRNHFFPQERKDKKIATHGRVACHKTRGKPKKLWFVSSFWNVRNFHKYSDGERKAKKKKIIYIYREKSSCDWVYFVAKTVFFLHEFGALKPGLKNVLKKIFLRILIK